MSRTGGSTLVSALDHALARILSWTRWLILPVVVLLFLQWPLRDLIRAYSREANDLGQWLFALYVAASFTSATRAGSHLCADVLARNYPLRARIALLRLGTMVGLIPWALLVLITGRHFVISSVLGAEAFPDTANPGYFIIKLALWVLAGLVLAQAMVDLARPMARAAS
jgi:TRAP-type mannitol/chloroaromatic compound transport system permease small subunit